MDLTCLKKEYEMELKESIKCTKSIKNLSYKEETLKTLYEHCFKQLIEKNYINNSNFINFSNKVIEIEDDERITDDYIWVIECTATVYTSIDK